MHFRVLLLLWLCLGFAVPLLAQEEEDIAPLPTDDPLLDPTAVAAQTTVGERTSRNFAFLAGLQYGVGPLLLTSPGIVVGVYTDPIIVGMEFVDSDILSAFDDLRKDGIGSVRITNNVAFGKVFVGQSFYVVGAYEQRSLELYDRGFIRYDRRVDIDGDGVTDEPGTAYYDMTINTTAATVGIGVQKFSENYFTSFDFIRWTIPLEQSYSVEDTYTNWDRVDGGLEDLESEKAGRRDRWYGTMGLPSAMVFTAGFVF